MKKAISLALSCAAITSWAPGAGAAEAKERFGNWQVQTLTDKMDDSTRGIALLRSSSAPTVLMLVKCDYAGDGVYIQFSGPVLGETNGRETRPFVYRLDKNNKQVEEWRYAQRGAIQIDVTKAKPFAKALMNSQSIIVRQYGRDLDTTDAEFSLDGAKQAVERVFAICKEPL